ncbi:MAG: flagellar basal body-associated FliL family protein [Chitinispirillaceae bacterium]|nr:flagellar basal body-associated FliL family protein [Chitinispirillaceae bacterium]
MDEKKPKEASPREREKEKEESNKGANASQKSNKMVLIGIIAGIIIVEIIAVFIVVKMVMPKPAVEAEEVMDVEGAKQGHEEEMTTMGSTTAEMPIEVVVNIAGTDGERFLKAAVVLEFEEEAEHKKKESGGHGHGGGPSLSPMAEAVLVRMPKFKSYLIEYLSKMTITEVTAPDAKSKIRKDFLRMVNTSLPPKLGEVKDIYFTQFIIQ